MQDDTEAERAERTERTPLLAVEGGSKQTAYDAANEGTGSGTQEVRERRKSSVGGSGRHGDSGFKSIMSRGRRRSSARHRRSDIVLGVSTDGQTVRFHSYHSY